MIILTTPTGNIGSKVLRALLDDPKLNQPVRVVVRDAGKLPAEVAGRVEIAEGSADDGEFLRGACKGGEALFWCQPDTPTAEDYLGAYERWSETARAAIDGAGIRRVVAISGAGEVPKTPAGPVSGLHRLEGVLSQSRAACRFLRCGSYFSNVLWQWEGIQQEGVFAYTMPGEVRTPQVAPEDIGRVAAEWLIKRDWDGRKAVSLLGPVDLSYDEVAAELTRQLGRPVRYVQMPEEAYREMSVGFGLSASAAQGLVDMFAYLATEYRNDPEADRSLTPTTFGEWLREVASSRGR